MSSSTVFIVLYTHQKTKKSKTWHDGRLKVHQDNTAHLYDDHNGHIDTLYIKPAQVYLGADLESAKYLITVDDNGNGELSKPLAPSAAAAGVIEAQCVQPKPAKTFTRTRMGFTVPRQVNTKLENGLKESPVEQSKFSPSITNISSRQQHCSENRCVITPCNKQFTGSNSNQQNKTSGILNSYSSEDVCDDRNGVESNSTAKSNICQPSLNQTNTGECQTNSIHAGMKRNRVQILELLGNKRKKFQVPVKQSNEVCSEMQTNPGKVVYIEDRVNVKIDNCCKETVLKLSDQQRTRNAVKSKENDSEETEFVKEKNDLEMCLETSDTKNIMPDTNVLVSDPVFINTCLQGCEESSSDNRLESTNEDKMDLVFSKDFFSQTVQVDVDIVNSDKLGESIIESHVDDGNEIFLVEDSIVINYEEPIVELEEILVEDYKKQIVENCDIGNLSSSSEVSKAENTEIPDNSVYLNKSEENTKFLLMSYFVPTKENNIIKQKFDNNLGKDILVIPENIVDDVEVFGEKNLTEDYEVCVEDCCSPLSEKTKKYYVMPEESKIITLDQTVPFDVSVTGEDKMMTKSNEQSGNSENLVTGMLDKNIKMLYEEKDNLQLVKHLTSVSKEWKNNFLIPEEENTKSVTNEKNEICVASEEIIHISDEEGTLSDCCLNSQNLTEFDDSICEVDETLLINCKLKEAEIISRDKDNIMHQSCEEILQDIQNEMPIIVDECESDGSQLLYSKKGCYLLTQDCNIEIISDDKDNIVHQSCDEISKQNFQNDMPIIVDNSEPEGTSDGSQLFSCQQVLPMSVSSSQETSTSADTFDFVPIASPVSKKVLSNMKSSDDIMNDYHSQTEYYSKSSNHKRCKLDESPSIINLSSQSISHSLNYFQNRETPDEEKVHCREQTLVEDFNELRYEHAKFSTNDRWSSKPLKQSHVNDFTLSPYKENTTFRKNTYDCTEVTRNLIDEILSTQSVNNAVSARTTKNRKNFDRKLNVSNKVEEYVWRGTKCSETAKRSSSRSHLRPIHRSDHHNDLYELEKPNLPDAFSISDQERQQTSLSRDMFSKRKGGIFSFAEEPYKWSTYTKEGKHLLSPQRYKENVYYGSQMNRDEKFNEVTANSISFESFMPDSSLSYNLIEADENLFYEDVKQDSRLGNLKTSAEYYQKVPEECTKAQSFEEVSEGNVQISEVYQEVPEKIRSTTMYQEISGTQLMIEDNFQSFKVAENIHEYSQEEQEDVMCQHNMYPEVLEETGDDQLYQKMADNGTFRSQKPLSAFCQEVSGFKDLRSYEKTNRAHTFESTDRPLSSQTPATDSKCISQYFASNKHVYDNYLDSSPNNDHNNRNLDFSIRQRKTIISQPPDVELGSNNGNSQSHECLTTSRITCKGSKMNSISMNKKKRTDINLIQGREGILELDTVPVIESNANSFNMNLTLDKSLTDELEDFFGDDVEEVFNAIGDNVSGPDSMQETTLQVSPHQNKQTETLHQIHFENKNTCSGNRNKDVVCRNKSTSLELLKSRNFQKPGLPDMKSCLETNNVIRTHDRNKSFQVFSEDQCLPYVNSVLPVPVNNLGSSLHNTQMSIGSKLRFSSKDEVDSAATPTRQTVIPILFEGIQVYKTILASAIKEHLNILMFSLSQQYHQALSKIDISNLTANCDRQTDATAPTCQHNIAAKIVCVKKDGANKGRFFYTCSQPRSSQCKFFLWADQYKPNKVDKDKINSFIPKMSSLMEMRNFMKSVGLSLHCGAKLIRKARGGFSQPNLPPWIKKYRRDMEDGVKKKLFLKLLHKDVSSAYAKDDIWVISGSLQFEPSSSFIAKSVYHGPSSNMELEIEPVTGYSPSNWPSDTSVHGLLLLNASSELAQLYNIDEHISLNSVPVLPYLMDSSYHPDNMKQASGSKAFKSPLCRTPLQHKIPCTSQEIVHLANEFIYNYHLNDDQAEALLQVASMFETTDNSCRQTPPITLIHGVFGAGKSFLLSVVVLFLVKLFAMKPDQVDSCKDSHWRLLISSTTNVAVDRILLGLLELGFEDFIRVGSLRKISKPILPYSVHASDKQNDDIKELQEMLKSDLTSSEKQLIKKSLERQRLGHNKALLAQVKVVAVTCAASVFPCIDKQKFPVVLLDECSQMTEPASLLPVAKFHCEEIVLVGDPKQLPPTIQKSESSTNYGLEQTLFDRLVAMGIEAIMLRTQYRCHPHISALSNHLFYENQLVDGVGTEQRQPLMDLPTLCFYNVHDGQEHCEANGSYYNLQEVTFVAALLQVILQHGVDAVEIGVITLYRAQAFKISEFLKTQTTMKPQDVQRIQISTVDAFQGGEKNVILLSCVRTDYVGFIDSYKRTNVALTRSKYHLFIIGHLRILSQNELWGQVIELCKERPNGIQSAKSFIKEWKDKNIDTSRPRSKKTVLEKKKADEALIEVVDLTELNDSCQKNVVDDQPTTIPIGNSEIPVDSQESLPYSPMDVPSTDDINSSRVTTPNKAFNMASSCPSQETSGLNQDSVKEHTSPFNSTIEEIQIIGSTSSSSSFKPIKETVLVDDLQRREPGTKAADVTTCQEREIQGTAVGEVFHNIDKENAIKSSVTHAKLAGISLSQEQNNLSDIDGYTSPSYSPLEEFEESFSSNNSFAGLEQIMTTMT